MQKTIRFLLATMHQALQVVLVVVSSLVMEVVHLHQHYTEQGVKQVLLVIQIDLAHKDLFVFNTQTPLHNFN